MKNLTNISNDFKFEEVINSNSKHKFTFTCTRWARSSFGKNVTVVDYDNIINAVDCIVKSSTIKTPSDLIDFFKYYKGKYPEDFNAINILDSINCITYKSHDFSNIKFYKKTVGNAFLNSKTVLNFFNAINGKEKSEQGICIFYEYYNELEFKSICEFIVKYIYDKQVFNWLLTEIDANLNNKSKDILEDIIASVILPLDVKLAIINVINEEKRINFYLKLLNTFIKTNSYLSINFLRDERIQKLLKICYTHINATNIEGLSFASLPENYYNFYFSFLSYDAVCSYVEQGVEAEVFKIFKQVGIINEQLPMNFVCLEQIKTFNLLVTQVREHIKITKIREESDRCKDKINDIINSKENLYLLEFI